MCLIPHCCVLSTKVVLWHVRINIRGSQFPSHQIVGDDSGLPKRIPQGPLSNLWIGSASDPTLIPCGIKKGEAFDMWFCYRKAYITMKSRLFVFTSRNRKVVTFVPIGAILVVIAIFCMLPIGKLALRVMYLEFTHSLALRDAEQSIVYAQQFMSLYPDATQGFSYYTGEYGSTMWKSEVGLYGRYILTMKIPVNFNTTRTSIVDYGEPLFYLDGVDSITTVEGDRIMVTQNIHLEFGKEEWGLLLKGDGDVSVLDEKIQKDNPVPRFEEYWDSLRGK